MNTSLPSNPRDFLKILGETFPVFRDYQPLAIGISAQVLSRYPGVDPKVLKSALYHHTSSTRYFKAMEKGSHRHDLDGASVSEVTEEHRKYAAEQLAERFKKQAERRKAEAEAKRAEAEAKKSEERRAIKLTQLTEKFAKR